MKLALALLLLAPSLAGAATCNVYTESEARIWDTRLLQIPAPALGHEHAVNVFVPKGSKLAAVFSREELSRRIAANEFKDLEGGSMIFFQQSYENRFDMSIVTIDASRTYVEMPSVMAVGGLTKEVGIGLLVPDQKVFVNCTEKTVP